MTEISLGLAILQALDLDMQTMEGVTIMVRCSSPLHLINYETV